uniref:Putative extracellular protein TR9_071c n=1 Tax=Trebouxia lynnae TaxID=1825957 RepID=A0A7L9QF52_9CHLO|nr:putative extracellular protein TR9_071c [Trebouxia lynnae]
MFRTSQLTLLTVVAVISAPSFFAQDPFVTGFDTEYPANYTGVGAEPVPTSASDGWHFPRPLFTAPETYPQRFSGLSCGPLPKGFTVSYRMLHTPEGTEDYAVHLTLLNPYPNNITGPSTGFDAKIFQIVADTWLNLRTGIVSALNYTQFDANPAVYTFNSSLDGQTAREMTGRADATVFNTVHSLNSDSFFGYSGDNSGKSSLSYYQYPPPAYKSVDANDSGTKMADEYNWMQSVESLRFYTGFLAMQAGRNTSCTPATIGWWELVPLLDCLTLILKTVTVMTDFSEYTAQYLGQLNTSYVQTNPDVSAQNYATLKTPSVYLPYDVAILDPALSLTESECIVRAKNYTLTEANMEGTAPANVWNYCSTGICNYTLLNGTSGTFVSPYAGTHTESICQMGYSNAVDNNEYVEPAYITGIGQGTAGRFNPDRPAIISPTGNLPTTNSSFVGASESTGSSGGHPAVPYSAGASNA